MGKPRSLTGFTDKTLIRTGRCIVDVMKFVSEDPGAPGDRTRYCQVFDAGSVDDVTLGTTVPAGILAATASIPNTQFWTRGLVFSNGIVVASTTRPAGAILSAAGTGHFFLGIG